ncbi:hypothetical protein [uncultured Clostridium sp.]|uniref:hypothetical protein n=1 Tax=uncultured Clostridium sp. TaxID=59620 RepID=UPI00260E030D|nr:hypothetical protein [uncultured Clostridium sp.]
MEKTIKNGANIIADALEKISKILKLEYSDENKLDAIKVLAMNALAESHSTERDEINKLIITR